MKQEINMDAIVVLVIGLICFILYKMDEQNKRNEKFKKKIMTQLINNPVQSAEPEPKPASSPIIEEVDTDGSESDNELNSILQMAKLAAESNGASLQPWDSKSKKRNFTFIQNNVGPSNCDNLNVQLGVSIHPTLTPGGLGLLGNAFASGMGGFLGAPPPSRSRSLPEK